MDYIATIRHRPSRVLFQPFKWGLPKLEHACSRPQKWMWAPPNGLKAPDWTFSFFTIPQKDLPVQIIMWPVSICPVAGVPSWKQSLSLFVDLSWSVLWLASSPAITSTNKGKLSWLEVMSASKNKSLQQPPREHRYWCDDIVSTNLTIDHWICDQMWQTFCKTQITILPATNLFHRIVGWSFQESEDLWEGSVSEVSKFLTVLQ